MKKTLEFLKELAANNDREWFNAHKDEYLAVKVHVEAFTQKLIDAVTELEPQARMLRPADCLYRIYRDTRFSADKSPYKTYIDMYINPRGGKKSEFCGYYVHIQPGECLVAGGAWFPEAPLLREYRSEIYHNADEYIGIISAPEFASAYQPYWQDPLKTAPKGFPKDWEHIDLLKPRNLVYASSLSDKEMESKDIVDKLSGLFRILKPYNDFFNFTLEEHPELAVRTPRRR